MASATRALRIRESLVNTPIRIAGQHANYTAAQLKLYRDGNVYGKGDNANAVMAGVAGALSDEEIQSLASYIEGLHHAVAE